MYISFYTFQPEIYKEKLEICPLKYGCKFSNFGIKQRFKFSRLKAHQLKILISQKL